MIARKKGLRFRRVLEGVQKAVERNRLKRRARAVTYPLLKDVPAGTCVHGVFQTNNNGQEIRRNKNEILSLYKKAKII